MAKKYIYNDYLTNITSKYAALLDDISANYNFDLGTEFELVICGVLQKVLPMKYGVCRGFVVAEDGQTEGDDIIIYDRSRFPQIRLFDENDLAHKQEIPIEAAYAYIEAKNSLINGQDNNGKDITFKKALMQVSKVKELVSKRESIYIQNAFNPYISFDVKIRSGRKKWPKQLNPFFAAVITPQVKTVSGDIIQDADKVVTALAGDYDDEFSPDLIVAGNDVCFLPHLQNDEKKVNVYHSPFYIEGVSIFTPSIVKDHAFSVGMCSLIYALDTICLGIMPWPSIIADALEIENV